MKFHHGAITSVLGVQLGVVGVLMLTALPFSFAYGDGDAGALALSALITLCAAAALWYWHRSAPNTIDKREGYLVVVLGWLLMASFGMLPYLISGEIPSVTNAFFETMSGMTTTGASVLSDIEAVPKGILFWRSMTQWIGGMGIIVLTVALFPLLGIGGIELFGAEAPGPSTDKIHPRIRETAKRLWYIYVGLTGICTVLLWAEGMSFYDAINHALTTLATGGFSTKNASAAAFETTPIIQYTLVLFMVLAGTNYTVLYFILKRKWAQVRRSSELAAYLRLLFVLTFVITAIVWYIGDAGPEKSFRDVLFQVVSLITTTGFVSADYTSWSETLTLIFFVMMFIGACAGSTSGGIKIIRHLVFFKNSGLEFKRLLYPRAVVPLKLNGVVVPGRVITHILVFLLIFLASFIIGSVVVSFMGMDFLSAIGAVATSLGNVGPGIGSVGPVNNFADVPEAAKWTLAFLMLLGRLELFTVLVLLTPYFWRDY